MWWKNCQIKIHSMKRSNLVSRSKIIESNQSILMTVSMTKILLNDINFLVICCYLKYDSLHSIFVNLTSYPWKQYSYHIWYKLSKNIERDAFALLGRKNFIHYHRCLLTFQYFHDDETPLRSFCKYIITFSLPFVDRILSLH